MKRITTAAALMVLGLSATAVAQEYSWVETKFHRVHLRNGNFIDGNVTGLTERDVYLKLRGVGEMNIRRDSIDRIELMKMRSLLEKPKLDPPLKKVEARLLAKIVPDPKAPGAVNIPVPDVDPALKDNVLAILSRLRVANPDQKEDLIADLSRMPNAGPYLASQMGTANDENVEYVAKAIAQLKDPESLPYLSAHLDSTREIVVISAIKLIGDHEDASWIPSVRPLLRHDQGAVRSTAIATLARLNDRDSLPAILDMLVEEDRAVRSGAIVASINLGRKFQEVDLVANQLRLALRNPSSEAKIDLLSAAGRLLKPDLWDAVAPYLRDGEDEVRCAAVDALGAMVAKDSADLLAQQMQVESETKVRLRMARTAGAIRSKKAIDSLLIWFRSEDGDLVRTVHRALQEITGKRLPPDPDAWAAWWDQTRDR
jgi:HEAT repeat protein